MVGFVADVNFVNRSSLRVISCSDEATINNTDLGPIGSVFSFSYTSDQTVTSLGGNINALIPFHRVSMQVPSEPAQPHSPESENHFLIEVASHLWNTSANKSTSMWSVSIIRMKTSGTPKCHFILQRECPLGPVHSRSLHNHSFVKMSTLLIASSRVTLAPLTTLSITARLICLTGGRSPKYNPTTDFPSLSQTSPPTSLMVVPTDDCTAHRPPNTTSRIPAARTTIN